MEITEKIFWEKFWEKMALPQVVDRSFKNDNVIAKNILKYIPKAQFDKKVLEIGCAPGKWLALFNKDLGYNIEGIEYIKAAAAKTIQNFELLSIPKKQYNVRQGDFLLLTPCPQFDVVFSLGFVEHFTDWENILDRHIGYCKPQAYLIVGLPSFRGINYFIQNIIDKHSSETKLLPAHNLDVMDLKKLESYARKRKLSILKLGYIGGFEPGLFNTNIPNLTLKYVLRCLALFCSILFANCNSRITGSYILGVFKLK